MTNLPLSFDKAPSTNVESILSSCTVANARGSFDSLSTKNPEISLFWANAIVVTSNSTAKRKPFLISFFICGDSVCGYLC